MRTVEHNTRLCFSSQPYQHRILELELNKMAQDWYPSLIIFFFYYICAFLLLSLLGSHSGWQNGLMITPLSLTLPSFFQKKSKKFNHGMEEFKAISVMVRKQVERVKLKMLLMQLEHLLWVFQYTLMPNSYWF